MKFGRLLKQYGFKSPYLGVINVNFGIISNRAYVQFSIESRGFRLLKVINVNFGRF